MSFNIGHALLGAAEGFLTGGPLGAVMGGVADGFVGTGGSGGGPAGANSLLALFGGPDSIGAASGGGGIADLASAVGLFA